MRWWIKLLSLVLLAALLAWLGYSLVAGLVSLLDGAALEAGERDPMFAAEPEAIARPSSLDAEVPPPDHPTLDDYVPDVQSPVYQSVDDLIREAQSASQAQNHAENAAK